MDPLYLILALVVAAIVVVLVLRRRAEAGGDRSYTEVDDRDAPVEEAEAPPTRRAAPAPAQDFVFTTLDDVEEPAAEADDWSWDGEQVDDQVVVEAEDRFGAEPTWEDAEPTWDQGDTWESEAPAEPEPAPSGGFSFSGATAAANDEFSFEFVGLGADTEIASEDEILKASEATEVHFETDGGNDELAKLLAKVQARLSAYD